MGDRCYMSITCRETDREKFNDDHYSWQDDGLSHQVDMPGCIEIFDDEVNYGNTDDLPKDVPFIGFHGSGSYSGAKFACDGKGKFEYTLTDEDSGYSVEFDGKTGLPSPGSVEAVTSFIKFRNEVLEILKQPAQEAVVGGAD